MNATHRRLATILSACAALEMIAAAAGPAVAEDPLAAKVAELRYRVTAIEHGKGDKAAAFDELATRADALVREHPKRPEPLVWKGIALSAGAKHKGLGALASVKEARGLLEAALAMNERVAGPVAHNALGMLYHRVPGWPVSFGNDKTAEAHFKKAIAASSCLDTHYRYGEYLMDEGRRDEALEHLGRALAFPDRPGHAEDPLKKEDIRALLGRLRK